MPGSKEADSGVPQACAALLSDLKYVRVAKAEHGDRLSARPRADRPPSMRAGDQCCPVTVIRLRRTCLRFSVWVQARRSRKSRRFARTGWWS